MAQNDAFYLLFAKDFAPTTGAPRPKEIVLSRRSLYEPVLILLIPQLFER